MEVSLRGTVDLGGPIGIGWTSQSDLDTAVPSYNSLIAGDRPLTRKNTLVLQH